MEILLYGVLGFDVLAADFVARFPATGKITLRINSLGGDVFTGRAIANAVAARRGDVTAVIDGVAASAATMIALAAGRVEMAANAQFMIHNPRASVFEQQAEGLRSATKLLDDVEAEYVAAYAAKTGISESKLRAMMDAETWFTAEEAKAAGFVDAIIESALELAALAALPFARFKYQNAPTFGEPGQRRSSHPVKTQLSGLIAQLLAKFATKERPESAILAQVTALAGADQSVVDAIAQGMFSVVPTVPVLEAFAKVLEADVATLKLEAGKDFAAFKTEPKPHVTAAQLLDVNAAIADASAKAQKRVTEIMALFLPYSGHLALRDECISNASVTPDAAGRLLLNALGGTGSPVQGAHYRGDGREDRGDKFRTAVVMAVMAKGDTKYAGTYRAELARNEFRGYRLLELCRYSLELAGLGHLARGNPIEVIGQAFTQSAFPTILEDIANKSMHAGWEEAPETFEAWTQIGNLVDFKAQSFMNLSEADDLNIIQDGAGEYELSKFLEGGEKVQLATFGRRFSITRQALINDDTGAFTQIPRKMGRAAKRKVGDLAYGVLTVNANMADGVALFHATHNNLKTGTAFPPSTPNFDASRVAMALQTGPNGKVLNIRPAFVLTPVGLQGLTKTVLGAEREVDQTVETRRSSNIPNYVREMAVNIADPRLDTNSTVAHYLVADPTITPTVVVGYLNGDPAPRMEQMQTWTTDGTEFKVSIDAAAKAIDWRGVYKVNGA